MKAKEGERKKKTERGKERKEGREEVGIWEKLKE